jgi:hypothetical protein
VVGVVSAVGERAEGLIFELVVECIAVADGLILISGLVAAEAGPRVLWILCSVASSVR